MKKFVPALLMSVLLAAPVWADFERGFYAGIGGSVVSGDGGTVFEDASLPLLELIGGYKYHAALGFELRAGVGLRDDTDAESERLMAAVAENPQIAQFDRELRTTSALYYRPELVNETARLYALLGYAQMGTRVTVLSGSEPQETLLVRSQTFSGPSYGLGVGFFMDEHLSVNFEYRSLVHSDGHNFGTFGVNLDYRF
ncbi:outer membrane beta-barrel protein [Marinimicrobium sp. ABcell2]|uniref:outer membrane beta-barrel protein n=1 Tax=Marinimicrobium sp. ABcell2 TaxID=3069751 RepID=UPI0027B29A18|nr:outer membrane beta-barrel protein [Marinimicrobium sp. ABcell2]MDQ2076703.1 outer membrane beta-barrel protein [Marinimicrobium sp. ABcell2]